MMKKLLFLLAMVFMAQTAWAIQAHSEPITVRQSDGTMITIRLVGDEVWHYYALLDGTPVVQNAMGDWVPGVLTQTQQREVWKQRLQVRNQQRLPRLKKLQQMSRAARAKGQVEQVQRKGLVILVNFTDIKHMDATPQATFDQLFNSIGNPYGSNTGSVREYFRAQSYDQFDLSFDVVGPVEVAHESAYYGRNDSLGNDTLPRDMIREACLLADEYVNYADYDWDGDGQVDQVYVIYAGLSESYSGSDPNSIWPHEWALSGEDGAEPLKLDGVTIDTYACSNELYGTPKYYKNPANSPLLEGIGTACHEFSHCLGFKDLYDTAGDGHIGMTYWDVMAGGNYRNMNYTPAPYTAYERMTAGWLTPVELTDVATVTDMPAITQEPVAYILYNDADKNEFYMLENHQKDGMWDAYAYGHGLMIMHVTYDADAWKENTVNSKDLQRVTLFPADGIWDEETLDGDLWDGTVGKTQFTDTTTPAATLNIANLKGEYFMSKPITEIAETDGKISFKLGNTDTAIKSITAPTVTEKTVIYDVMGRRMKADDPHLPSGVYIVNGKKVVK